MALRFGCASATCHQHSLPLDRGMSDQILTITAETILGQAFFDVDDYSENFLKLKLSIEPLNYFDSSANAPVYGLSRPKNRSISICTRTQYYEPLYRTTMMHEVGHVILHGQHSKSCLSYSPASPIRPSYEQEADQFMVVALLPKSVLHLNIALCAHYHHIEIFELLLNANTERGRWQWRRHVFPFIINTLCVSRELVSIKMKRLGVFSEETVNFHRSYRLSNKWLTDQAYHPLAKTMCDIQKDLSCMTQVLDRYKEVVC